MSNKTHVYNCALRGYGTRPLILAAGAAALVQLIPSAAFAQEPSSDQTLWSEIIVTAQKRAQSVQDVPVAITAFSSEQIEKLGLSTATSVGEFVPNFSYGQRDRGAPPLLSIRGISFEGGQNYINEGSIATYVDEVYLGSSPMLTASNFDVQRVEVLRGPQGTLFGRNASGGLVHFVSAQPTTTLSGFANLTYAEHSQVIFEGALSGPFSDTVRGRIATRLERSDGAWKNVAVGPARGKDRAGAVDHDFSLRGIVEADLGSSAKLNLSVTYNHRRAQPTPVVSYGLRDPATGAPCSIDRALDSQCNSVLGPTPDIDSDEYVGNQTLDINTNELVSATGRFEWDIGGATLTSITNYAWVDYRYALDAEGGPTLDPRVFDGSADFGLEANQFSQEIRLSGRTGGGADWVVGGYYYSDDKDSDVSSIFSGILFGLDLTAGEYLRNRGLATIKTNSAALFGQVDLPLSEQVTLSIGGRYTDEQRKLTALQYIQTASMGGMVLTTVNENTYASVPQRKIDVTNFTGKLGVQWHVATDQMLYAQFSRGFKSGGYNVEMPAGTLASRLAGIGPVDQETLDAYEVGYKSSWMNGRLIFNMAAFYYQYSGVQQPVTTFDLNTLTRTNVYINAGDAELYGAEFELNYRPSGRFDIKLGLGLLHNEITDSDIVLAGNAFSGQPASVPLEGRKLVRAPSWNANAIVAYHIPAGSAGTFSLQGEVVATDKMFSDLTNNRFGEVPQRENVNLRVLWASESGDLTGQVFVTNVFDDDTPTFLPVSAIGSLNFVQGSRPMPRTFGIRLGASF